MSGNRWRFHPKDTKAASRSGTLDVLPDRLAQAQPLLGRLVLWHPLHEAAQRVHGGFSANPVTSNVSKEDMFTDQVFTQADVMGTTSAIDETRCDAALAATVTDLILTINHGTATQTDLDRYAFAYF